MYIDFSQGGFYDGGHEDRGTLRSVMKNHTVTAVDEDIEKVIARKATNKQAVERPACSRKGNWHRHTASGRYRSTKMVEEMERVTKEQLKR